MNLEHPESVCIFCMRTAPVTVPYCNDNPGKGCTYGMQHEFLVPLKPAIDNVQKRDAKLCLKCNLHPKNPTFNEKGCDHEFST